MWEWFSLFSVHMLAKPYHSGERWPTTHCKIKDGVLFFTLNFECCNRYKKLLLCNSENSHIAWWNENKSEWGFSVFLKRWIKSCFFLKNPKKRCFRKNKKAGGLSFLKKNGFFSTLTTTVTCSTLHWYNNLQCITEILEQEVLLEFLRVKAVLIS